MNEPLDVHGFWSQCINNLEKLLDRTVEVGEKGWVGQQNSLKTRVDYRQTVLGMFSTVRLLSFSISHHREEKMGEVARKSTRHTLIYG